MTESIIPAPTDNRTPNYIVEFHEPMPIDISIDKESGTWRMPKFTAHFDPTTGVITFTTFFVTTAPYAAASEARAAAYAIVADLRAGNITPDEWTLDDDGTRFYVDAWTGEARRCDVTGCPGFGEWFPHASSLDGPAIATIHDPHEARPTRGMAYWGITVAFNEGTTRWEVEAIAHDSLNPVEARGVAHALSEAAAIADDLNGTPPREANDAALARLVQKLTATDLLVIGDLFDFGPAEVMRRLTPPESVTLRRPATTACEPDTHGAGGGL
ncbi:hypothetical protein GCM10011490_06840 [Pseudoclavibacter endophyticus]|uniref:Uncharacterized protein n=1 Tax=Pseudoclavibacter endophyticus TaxID=1778590 RepID=A0A6H9WFU0_9MICO|nr:hypothetical protein [Pseudoclavibacter endophyticus]KAB1649829.1 hypothetical protein F8O04_06265 [Pseudoclavibacter endophyticus]GGA59444.1 hypothetical protein GCM10011490_06840 [Pseudoclavibacter endophyticus]